MAKLAHFLLANCLDRKEFEDFWVARNSIARYNRHP